MVIWVETRELDFHVCHIILPQMSSYQPKNYERHKETGIYEQAGNQNVNRNYFWENPGVGLTRQKILN